MSENPSTDAGDLGCGPLRREAAYHGLHVLVDDDPRWGWGRDPVAQARAACRAGVPVVQLRAKLASDHTCLAWAREIRALTRASGSRFVVNDRFDIALLAEADAVHLGQSDLPPAALPREARRRLAVGRSTHTRAQLLASCDEEVDYVAFGPVFGTRSKSSDYSARGTAAVAEAVQIVAPRPVVVIGGIHAVHLAGLRSAGASGFAVISALAASPDPERSARALMAAFDGREAEMPGSRT